MLPKHNINSMILLDKYSSGKIQPSTLGYNYFMPSKINSQWSWNNQEINSLLENAAIKIGELNSFARLVPNIDLFIELHVTKEAVVSSRIEGTQTNINEALMKEAEIDPERRNDWREVRNYVRSMNTAIEDLKILPISSRLICHTHKILLSNVRGEEKLPGEYRRSQNWIGGSSPSDAVFVPPAHQFLGELMGDLENFIHNDDVKIPSLIKIAIAHYQFETIHPFLDGNGRIGRLLITLLLIDMNIMTKPLLYLSSYFEKDKSLYYDNLTFVRTRNNMTQWLKYFLVGVAETADKATTTLSSVLEMKSRIETEITLTFGRRAGSAISLFQYLLKSPVIDVNDAKKITGLSYKASNTLVSKFVEAKILQPFSRQERNRIFSFDEYLQLF